MKRRPSISIEDLKKSPCWELNKHLFEPKVKKAADGSGAVGGTVISKVYPQKSKEKMAIETFLFDWSQKKGLVLQAEYRFTTDRKWRFDWCIPDLMLAVEYNGIISKKSRHTTISGYSGDMDKINAAQKLGWRVFQYTPLNYRDIETDFRGLQLLS